jgi:hypothetical protein
LEEKSIVKSELKPKLKSEVKTEQYVGMPYEIKTESFDQKIGIKSEGKLERPVLLPLKAEIDQKPAVNHIDIVNSVRKTEGKRPFTPDGEPASAKRVKHKPTTETSDIILTTYSLIWRDLSELQKKHFGM